MTKEKSKCCKICEHTWIKQATEDIDYFLFCYTCGEKRYDKPEECKCEESCELLCEKCVRKTIPDKPTVKDWEKEFDERMKWDLEVGNGLHPAIVKQFIHSLLESEKEKARINGMGEGMSFEAINCDKHCNEAQKQGEKDGWKQGELHGVALGRQEERQFLIKKIFAIEHICRFNDLPQKCDCFHSILDEVIKLLK